MKESKMKLIYKNGKPFVRDVFGEDRKIYDIKGKPYIRFLGEKWLVDFESLER